MVNIRSCDRLLMVYGNNYKHVCIAAYLTKLGVCMCGWVRTEKCAGLKNSLTCGGQMVLIDTPLILKVNADNVQFEPS